MTTWLTNNQREAWKNLQLMQLQLSSELSRRLAPFGLTLQDYYVLAHLDDQGGRMRIVEENRRRSGPGRIKNCRGPQGTSLREDERDGTSPLPLPPSKTAARDCHGGLTCRRYKERL